MNFYFDLRPPVQTPGQTPGQDRGAETRPQGQLECENPRGSPRGVDVQAWNWLIHKVRGSLKCLCAWQNQTNSSIWELMYQSIPAVNIPPGDPRDRTSFLPSPPGFYLQICAWGAGFRWGQIFPEMNENVLNTFIFRECFQEVIQKGRKLSFLFKPCSIWSLTIVRSLGSLRSLKTFDRCDCHNCWSLISI